MAPTIAIIADQWMEGGLQKGIKEILEGDGYVLYFICGVYVMIYSLYA